MKDKMELEEATEILEKLISKFKVTQSTILDEDEKELYAEDIQIEEIEAIETVLQALRKLQEENCILKNRQGVGKIKEVNVESLSEVLSPYYIPKKKIEDKVNLLENLQKEFPDNEEIRIKIISYKELLKED